MPRPPCRIHQQRNSPSRRGDSAQDVRRCDGCAGLAASSASYKVFAATRQGCARLHRLKRSRRGSAGVPRRAAKVLRVALPVTRTSWRRQRCGNHRQGRRPCERTKCQRCPVLTPWNKFCENGVFIQGANLETVLPSMSQSNITDVNAATCSRRGWPY